LALDGGLEFSLLYTPDMSQRGQPAARNKARKPDTCEEHAMTTLMTNLLNDENGFLVSAELVLISTIAILGLIVGLSEVSFAINNELEDVAAAFGSINQSYHQSGSWSAGKGGSSGSSFEDEWDDCDDQWDIQSSGWQGER